MPHHQQAAEVHQRRQDPADGVAEIEGGGRAEQLEDGGDPDQTEQAAAHEADHHRQDGVAPAAQTAGQHVHAAAEQVGGADDVHTGQTGRDHGLVGGVEVEQLLAQQGGTTAQHEAGDGGAEQTVAHDAVEVVIAACAHVLAGEGDGGLREGVHGRVDEALEVGGGRVARHDGGAEGVDRRLDDDVGEAEHGALQPGGQADAQDLAQRPRVEAQMAEVEVERAFLLHQQGRDHAGGNGLADDGGQRDARHAHGEEDDEDEIQHHIDDARHGQTEQRPFGVAHGTQQRRAEVVQHGHGHPDEVDLEVEGGQVDDVLGAAHQLQQAPGREDAHHGQKEAADEAQRHRRLDGGVDALLVLCAEAAGRDDVRAQRQAHEQVDQQVDECAVGAHCRQRRAARKTAHDHHVSRIEQQLQDAGCRQRQGKQDDLLQHGAAGQIAGPGILCHGNTLPPRRSEDHSRKNAPSNSGRRRYIYIIIQACVKHKQKTGKFESFPYKKAPPQMQGRHCETEAYFWVFM